MRPTDFRSAEKVYRYCTDGLPEEQHLGSADEESKSGVTITGWIAHLKLAFEERGLDTVMRPYNGTTRTELYMLNEKTWGRVTKSDVTAWVSRFVSSPMTSICARIGIQPHPAQALWVRHRRKEHKTKGGSTLLQS